jgi:hypothetical protein
MEVLVGLVVLAFIVFVAHRAFKNRKAVDRPNGTDIKLPEENDDLNPDNRGV